MTDLLPKILPCYYCGHLSPSIYISELNWISCWNENCTARGRSTSTPLEAINEWNRIAEAVKAGKETKKRLDVRITQPGYPVYPSEFIPLTPLEEFAFIQYGDKDHFLTEADMKQYAEWKKCIDVPTS